MSRVLALLLLAAAAAPAAAVTGHDALMRELTTGALDVDIKHQWQAATAKRAAAFAHAVPRSGSRALLVDYDTCFQNVPCNAQISNAWGAVYGNDTVRAITNPAQCPIGPGFADRSYFDCSFEVGFQQAVKTNQLSPFFFPQRTQSDCSAGSPIDVALTFPCFVNIVAALYSSSISASAGPSCPSVGYTCNCLATIATSCPKFNLTAWFSSSSSSEESNVNPCYSPSNDSSGGDSLIECPSWTTTFDNATSVSAVCPANFGSGAPKVLTTVAATTAPAIVMSPINSTCYGLLGLPVPPPPPPMPPKPPTSPATTAPVAVVSAAITLSGISAAQFNTAAQTSFITATAATLNVAADDVDITKVTDAPTRRRLTAAGVRVDFTVQAPTASAAASLSSAITTATTSNSAAFSARLVSAGLTQVSSIALTVPPSAAEPAKSVAAPHLPTAASMLAAAALLLA